MLLRLDDAVGEVCASDLVVRAPALRARAWKFGNWILRERSGIRLPRYQGIDSPPGPRVRVPAAQGDHGAVEGGHRGAIVTEDARHAGAVGEAAGARHDAVAVAAAESVLAGIACEVLRRDPSRLRQDDGRGRLLVRAPFRLIRPRPRRRR